MRILFINTSDESGGAALAAKRMMKGLRELHQTENSLIVRFKNSADEDVQTTVSSFFPKAFERTLNFITCHLGMQYLYFPFSTSRILEYANEIRPDIINLHNSHGGYFEIPILEKLSKLAPIVWTLHDMWSFTGNAAYTFGNTSWMNLKNDTELKKLEPAIGINTGALLLRLKKRIYSRSNLTIVTPSKWLKTLAEQSPVFEQKIIHQIYNGIDRTIFRKKDKLQCRESLGFLPGEKIILFAAQKISVNNPRKGGRDLVEILKRINERTTHALNLLILGEGEMEELSNFSGCKLHRLGYITDENLLCNCYNAADLVLFPSRADNLPNVLVEAISCGTPCISFKIGGIEEIITNENGILIPPFDFDAFAEGTLALLNNPLKLSQFSENCTLISDERFTLSQMADKYYHLFKSVLESNAM